MAFEDLEITAPSRPRRGTRRWLAWTAVVMFGLLVWELTTQPALGAAMLSLKFGWRDFRAALWLRRTDPDPHRGRACFWLYVANGLWKIALVSVVIFWIVAVLATPWQGLRVQQQRREFFVRVLAFGIGLAVVSCGWATLASYVALFRARCVGIKLWLHDGVVRTARTGDWPPNYGDRNRSGRVFGAAGMTVYLAGFVILAAVLHLLEVNNVVLDPAVRLAVLLTWLPLVGPTLARGTIRLGRRQSARAPRSVGGRTHFRARPSTIAISATGSLTPDMTFLVPALLAGLAMTAVPVILHLVMRQQPKHQYFPAFRFLKRRLRTNQRKLRLRQLLLLLLRMALIALICLALARPRVFNSRIFPGGGQVVVAVFVIDVSPSMEYAVAGKARLDDAKQRVVELLGDMSEGSRVAILDTADIQREWESSPSAVQERLKQITIRPGSVSVTEAVGGAYRLFQELDASSGGSVGDDATLPHVLYVVSDRTIASWDANRVADLAAQRDRLTTPVSAFFLDVGVDAPADLALFEVESQRTAVALGQPVVLRLTVRAVGQAFDTQVTCRFDGETGAVNKAVKLDSGQSQIIEFRKPDLKLGFHQAEFTLATGDSLPFNNVRFATVEVVGPRKVLVVTPETEDAERYGARYGIWPFVLNTAGYFACDTKTQREIAGWGPKDFGKYEVVCLLSLVRPDEPAGDSLWDKLLPYVKEGGKLAILPGGDEVEPRRYWDGKAQSLMPARMLDAATLKPDGGLTWAEGNYQHPLMARFRETMMLENVDWVRNPRSTWLIWRVKPADGATVIQTYSDGTPALVEKPIDPPNGHGRVLLFTTPLDLRRDARDRPVNDYIENSFYLTLANNTMRYLAGDLQDEVLNFSNGRDIVIALPTAPRFPAYKLIGPGVVGSDENVAPPDPKRGGNDLVIKAPPSAGNFSVVGGNGAWTSAFHANPPAAESLLERVPVEQVEALLGPNSVVPTGSTRSLRELFQARFSQPVEFFAWLMILLLLALAIENWMANKFYRRGSAAEPESPAAH